MKRFAQVNVSQCSHGRASAYVGGPNLLTWYGIYHIHQAIPVQGQRTEAQEHRVDVDMNIRADLQLRDYLHVDANKQAGLLMMDTVGKGPPAFLMLGNGEKVG